MCAGLVSPRAGLGAAFKHVRVGVGARARVRSVLGLGLG